MGYDFRNTSNHPAEGFGSSPAKSYVRLRCTGDDCPFCSDGLASSAFTCRYHKETRHYNAREVSALIRRYLPLYRLHVKLGEAPACYLPLAEEDMREIDKLMDALGLPGLKPLRGVRVYRIKVNSDNTVETNDRRETGYDYAMRLLSAFNALVLRPEFRFEASAEPNRPQRGNALTLSELVAGLREKVGGQSGGLHGNEASAEPPARTDDGFDADDEWRPVF